MLVTKPIVSLFATIALGTGAALAWQLRTYTLLKADAAREVTAAELRALEHQVATQFQKLAEAEARLSVLLKTANPMLPGATSAGAPVRHDAATDTNEIAKAAIERGRALVKDGKSQEALELYLASYREVQPLRPGSSACQRITSEMRALGRTFPPALAALAQLRDDAMSQLPAQPGRRGELSFEIALLNERLAQGSRTLALFDALPPGDSQRGSLALVARDAFIEARRYSDALLGRPFGQMFNLVDSSEQHLAKETDPQRQAMIRKSVVEQTATNIEVLAGSGRADEAQQLTQKLLAFDSSPSTRRILEQHLARAEREPR